MRTTFAVGRLNSDGAEIVLLEDDVRPTFPGPWTLRAVVRDPASSAPSAEDSARPPRQRRDRDEAAMTVHRQADETVH